MLFVVALSIASTRSKDLAALHSVSAIDGSPCTSIYLDVGSHSGGSLWDWFQRLNCYESCGGNSTCRPENWSAQNCKFCNSANADRQCGWMWPWWLPRDIRQGYCAIAFEPSAASAKLSKRVDELRSLNPGLSIRIVNDTAVSNKDGEAAFGIDTGAYDGRSSSLALSRKSPLKGDPNKPKEVGAAVEVGSQLQQKVKTLDFVHYLRALKVQNIALWLDAEGSEFTLMRDLITSGVMCGRVDNLWMDWHPNRIHWGREGLPTSDTELYKVYKWMLTSMDNSAKHQTGTADPDSHCKTVMFTVGERR